ncbi:hypothetical protein [Polyangium spumosum]|uniref:Uncharacterized protein n=1 Tax=Polyangium spumosum TaxID=889282 RepID=A0A6N7PLQ2_9BACT|nr:hypothetical protein [Polyangium spumosum]MRG91766.1 hypothetical protein [Polyangium spumosum]
MPSPPAPKLLKKKPAPGKPAPPRDAAFALAEVRAEVDALPESELLPVNVDVPRAVAIVLGAAPHLAALRERFVAELPKHPIRYIDNLKNYALAAWYSHLLSLPAPGPENTVKKLLEEASPLRESLLVAAEALAHRGFFEKERVAEIRSGQGHLDTANDLVALAALFSEHWSAIEHKTAVEWAEVERAAAIGPDILVAVGERELPRSGEKPDDPTKLRVRAFSLLAKAYDQCRRGAAYLAWGERDLDEIAPSLYSARGAGRRMADTEADGPAEPTGQG